MFLGYTANAQVADSVLYELENDTLPAKKNKSIKATIDVDGKQKKVIDIQVDEEVADEMEFSEEFDSDEEPDTIRVRVGKKRVIIVDDDEDVVFDSDDDDDGKFEGHWNGLALGLNSYMKPDFETDLSPDANFMELNTNKSWEVGLNFGEKSFNLYRDHIGLVTGLGLTWNNYKFDQNITLDPDSSYISFYVDPTKDYTKNKLTTMYLNIPLLLEFQIPTGENSKPIHLNAGVVGGLKVGSHTKQVYEVNNKEYKDKVKEDFHLSPLRYAAHASIGYGSFTIYSTYSMSTLFENGEGPELYPFTIGIIFGD